VRHVILVTVDQPDDPRMAGRQTFRPTPRSRFIEASLPQRREHALVVRIHGDDLRELARRQPEPAQQPDVDGRVAEQIGAELPALRHARFVDETRQPADAVERLVPSARST